MIRALFQFLVKYQLVIFFIILEVLAFSLFINRHAYQRTRIFNSSNIIAGNILNSYRSITNYLYLKQSNEELVAENVRLYNLRQSPLFRSTEKSQTDHRYQYIPAQVINNSVTNSRNFITLNKGRLDGVAEEMAVVSPTGAVGVVYAISDYYAVAISILNEKFRISAKIKRNDYFGSLHWNTLDARYADLEEIPGHVDVQLNDTLVTSGYSSIFPEGILIGFIQEIHQKPGSNFLNLKVKLAPNFQRLNHVYIIKNKDLFEIKQIEKEVRND